MHVRIFQSSSQLEGSYVSNLLYRYHKQSGAKWGKEAPYIEKLNASSWQNLELILHYYKSPIFFKSLRKLKKKKKKKIK